MGGGASCCTTATTTGTTASAWQSRSNARRDHAANLSAVERVLRPHAIGGPFHPARFGPVRAPLLAAAQSDQDGERTDLVDRTGPLERETRPDDRGRRDRSHPRFPREPPSRGGAELHESAALPRLPRSVRGPAARRA